MESKKEMVVQLDKVVEDTRINTLQGLILDDVFPNTALMTDDYLPYSGIKNKGYKHPTVKDSRKDFVNGMIHTNDIERFGLC